MTSNLPDTDRAVWTDAYTLHEKYQNMRGTDQDFIKLSNEVKMLVAKHEKTAGELAKQLFLAVYLYFDATIRANEEAARIAPEQMTMEMVPWI